MHVMKVKKEVKDIDDVSYGKLGDAGLDLRASGRWVIDIDSDKKEIESETYALKPNERVLVKTGIKVEIPQGYWGNIRGRSGLGYKKGLNVLSGVIDETYRGEIGVILVNHGKGVYVLSKNERVAQMIITPHVTVDIVHIEDLSDSNRGETGFGDSGSH